MQTDAAPAGVIRTVELLMLKEAAFWRLNESVQAKIRAHVYTHRSSHPARLSRIRGARIQARALIRVVEIITIVITALDAVDDGEDDCNGDKNDDLDQKAHLLLEQKHADEH